MAGRPSKIGLDYFELDCHMEEKVELIEAEFGLKGFAIIVKLYQSIYSGFGYYCEWTPDISLLWARRLGVSHGGDSGNLDTADKTSSLPGFPNNLINNVVAASIKRNIFSEKLFNQYHILTSSGVQKRYLNATSKREKVEMKKEYLLLSDGKISNNVVINPISDGINSISDVRNEQSREKKSKEEKRRINSSCTELDKPASEPVIELILNDKSFYSVCQNDVDEWKMLYPAVDVMQELRKMKGWCDSNPAKRKTRRGIKRFINSWLSRQQDKGRTSDNRQVKNQFNNYQQSTSPQAINELENLFMRETNGG